MPEYKVHQKVNAIILTIFTVISIILLQLCSVPITMYHITFAISFILSSWILTPDLDTKSIPFYRWSWGKIVWTVFQKFSKHRGILHNPIFSPIILCFPLIILQWKFGLKYELVGIYAGITVQIGVHIASDWIGSKKKRVKW